MDWGRAKTILIFSFLFLNLLLGYQLWFNKLDLFGSFEELNQNTMAAKKLLENKGIRLETEIPKETPNVKDITVTFSASVQPEIILLENQVNNSTLINKADLKKVLIEQIPHAEGYEFDAIRNGEGYYVMNQLYEGLPMFEVNLKLYYAEGWIHSYSQSYVDVSTEDDQKEQKVLSASKAVEFLAENYLSRGSAILDVRLGYHGQSYNSDTQNLFPKWRVITDERTIYYIHAINGEVEEVRLKE